MFFELSKGSDPVLELPLPIVPEFRRPAFMGPVTRRVRDELFPIPIFWCSRHHLSVKKAKALKYRVNAGTFECAAHNGVLAATAARNKAGAIFRRAHLAPSGNHRDHETKGPCFLSPALRDRFRRPDLQYLRRRSSNARALSGVSPCLANETTCDQWFRVTASP